MHKNEKVLSFDISVDSNIFSGLSDINFINIKKAPITFLNNKKTIEDKLFSWITHRCFGNNRPDFFELTNFLNDNYSNHNFSCIYFCSLYTYAFSLSDKYWLNPEMEYHIGSLFKNNPIQFTLKPTTYEELQKFVNNPSDDISNIIKIILSEPTNNFTKNLEK